jgi:simple sugar transport system permease protein
MFGYTDGLQLRDADSVHALLLVVAIILLAVAAWRARRAQMTAAVVMGVLGFAFLAWFLLSDQVPSDFTGTTPYVATLLVLALAAQRLRMPAADGLRYRRGQSV